MASDRRYDLLHPETKLLLRSKSLPETRQELAEMACLRAAEMLTDTARVARCYDTISDAFLREITHILEDAWDLFCMEKE